MHFRKQAGRIFLFLVCVCTAWLPRAGASAQEPPRYEILATLDDRAREIVLEQRVAFVNPTQRPLTEVYFHIYSNRFYNPKEKGFMQRYGGYFKVKPFLDELPEQPFQVEGITSGGTHLDYQIEGDDRTLLKVLLSKPVAPGETVAMDLACRVMIPHMYGRFGWHRNVIKLSHWYPVLSVIDADGWHKYPFYPFHRPFFSAAAFYEVEMTLPASYVAVHTGQQVKDEALGDGRKTLAWKTSQPVRDFTLALSPDYCVVRGYLDDIQLNSYYLPGDEQAARRALNNARSLMQYYTERFGPYPFAQFSLAPVHLGYGGEQMSNMAFIDTRVYKLPGFLKRYFDFLISHETGHQWFYNLVGIDEYTQMWLEEGVNSFFIQEYLADKYGPDASIIDYPAWFRDWEGLLPRLTFRRTRDVTYKMLARVGYDHKVVDKLWAFREPSTIFSLTYGKGARILEMLKYYLGPEVFANVFTRIFSEYRFRNLNVEHFVRICEEESGRDLEWFFHPWLHTARRFDYAVADVEKNVIYFSNLGQITMPAPVRVRFEDGREETLVWEGRSAAVTLDDARTIAEVFIDPEGVLLDVDRTNNVWPRQVFVHAVPFYLPLYEQPVFLPEDGYTLTVGPETAHSGLGLKAAFQKPFDYIFYVASDYEFGESLVHERAGYQLRNLCGTQTALGVEVKNTDDLDGDEEDVLSGKLYLRRELWPARYGLLDLNDHLTLYLVRNQRLNDRNDSTSPQEDNRNLDYGRRNESIAGLELHMDTSGPYPDPSTGYQFTLQAENAGHFWGADQYFYRTALDYSLYKQIDCRGGVLAGRIKYGWGHPNDKTLYYIGGLNGLRGYERKTVRGANVFLSSLEYRLPLFKNIDAYFLDNILGLQSLGAVVFVDAGQAWFGDFDDTTLKADAGLGLRLTFSVGSFLEKLMLRLDVAQSINDTQEDTRFWFGVNHAF